MVTPRVSDINGIINKIAPLSLAEDWDNPGLQVGDPAALVEKVLVALDPTAETVAAAIEMKASLLVTHHPLVFRSLKRISLAEPIGRLLATAISANLAIVSMHTNYDSASDGLNDLLARKIGLEQVAPLKVATAEELVKLAVFVPEEHEGKVMEALFRFSGFIGNYSECSYRGQGLGTFRPNEGAQPFVGSVGRREEVREVRLEVLLRRADLDQAIRALQKAHPYEEPAYDLYPLLNRGKDFGLGRVGRQAAATSLRDYALSVKAALGAAAVRVVGDGAVEVRKVALCSGSGASFIADAKRVGADVLVTGDVKYHDALQARDAGIALIDAGHFATEVIMAEEVARRLSLECGKRGYDCEVIPCTIEMEPFEYLV